MLNGFIYSSSSCTQPSTPVKEPAARKCDFLILCFTNKTFIDLVLEKLFFSSSRNPGSSGICFLVGLKCNLFIFSSFGLFRNIWSTFMKPSSLNSGVLLQPNPQTNIYVTPGPELGPVPFINKHKIK